MIRRHRVLPLALCCSFGVLFASASTADPVFLDGGDVDAALAEVEGRAEGGADPSTHPVLHWNAPPVTGRRYVLSGRVRYEGVEGAGYLEMWSHFGAEGSYFTRTHAEAGPLAQLEGDSGWRPFALPFDTGDSGLVPQRIELNIVLPGHGRVEVGALRWSGAAASLHGGVSPTSTTAPGRIAAWLGTALGLLGAVIGTFGGRGRARGTVMGAIALAVGLSSLALGAALWGLVAGRGLPELLPLAVVGALGLLGVALVLPALKRRYADVELRKMRALDLDTRPLVPRS